MSSYKKSGWYGHSHQHSLAAKGISTKKYLASKATTQIMYDPVFYAAKQESEVPFTHCMSMVREGKHFQEMERMHPDADRETMRLRAIKAYDAVHGADTLSTINKNGVDENVRLAMKSPRLREQMLDTISDRQARSMIAEVKVESLKTQLEGMK